MTNGPAPTVTRLRERFLFLHGLRWLSTGLVIPVLILLMLDRGLSLGQIGLVVAMQGVAVFLLELPTGGLADSFGRRNVLLVASAFSFTSFALFAVAQSFVMFAVVWGVQGVYRALESGPLDSWYVDAAQAVDPDAEIEKGLAQGGVVLGVAVASGSLASSGLVAWAPIEGVEPLVTPILVALLVVAIEFVAIAVLMTEPRGVARPPFRTTVHEVPTVIRTAIAIIASSRVLRSLVAVEVLWGFGMTAFELFTPTKLEILLGSVEDAAQLMGPTQTAGWVASAVGAALIPRLVDRIGAERSGMSMLALQGLFVVGIGLAAGPTTAVIAFVLTLAVHGAANPVHQGLLHRTVVDPGTRATVISANSLCAKSGSTIGGIALGALADATSVALAVGVGAAIIASAGPLYLLARRARLQAAQTTTTSTVVQPDHV